MLYVITNRKRKGGSYGGDEEPDGGLHFLIAKGTAESPGATTEVPWPKFRTALRAELGEIAKALVNEFGEEPELPGVAKVRPTAALYLHGYNNGFADSLDEYHELDRNLRAATDAPPFHGVLVAFSWPSAGRTTGYRQDRLEASQSVPGLCRIFGNYKQLTETEDCVADTAVIAHSMGNYVLQESLAYFSDQIGAPAGGALVDQTLLLAADVDDDALHVGGEAIAVANLSYRSTVYYSPHDEILRKSQKYKHKGKRRLGRNGPPDFASLSPKVIALDCRRYAEETHAKEHGVGVHSSYKHVPAILRDMLYTMSGKDREMIPNRTLLPLTNRQGFELA